MQFTKIEKKKKNAVNQSIISCVYCMWRELLVASWCKFKVYVKVGIEYGEYTYIYMSFFSF